MALAQLIDSLPGLTFKGIMSHQMMTEPSSDREDRVTEIHRLVQPVLDLKDAIVAVGLPVEIISTGETWSYDVACDVPGVTEIQGGTYLVMETGYEYMPDFPVCWQGADHHYQRASVGSGCWGCRRESGRRAKGSSTRGRPSRRHRH